MQTRKTIIGLLAMAVMGVLALWGLGALWSHGMDQPLEHVASRGSGNALTAGPLAVVITGTQRALETAAGALQAHNRSEAVTALDAARRVARVAHHSAGPTFAAALNDIETARRSIQNGDFAAAGAPVSKALAELAGQMPTGRDVITAMPQARSLGGYRGATVLNAEGVRIGELRKIDADRAILVVGGSHDVFGFIDLGGELVEVPSDWLLFGKQDLYRGTQVTMPVLGTQASDIRSAVTPR